VFAATVKARPVDRPLPVKTMGYQTHVSTGGTVTVDPYAVFVGCRYPQLPVTAIRDGEHIAIVTGTTLIRALDADPTKHNQPLGAHRANPTTH
jgi:hypothetical protein